jgi:uncharacterized protein YgbK (DUF1537 family)
MNNPYSKNIQSHIAGLADLIFKTFRFGVIAISGGETLFNIFEMLGIKKLKVIDSISHAIEVNQANSKFGNIIIVSKGVSIKTINVFKEILDCFNTNNNGENK